MGTWRKIEVLDEALGYETDRGVLVRCPSDSEFKNKKFWAPKALFRRGYDGGHHRLLIPNDMTFTLLSSDDEGKRNVSADDIVEAFGEVIDWEATTPLFDDVEVVIRHIPEYLEPVVATVDEDLMR